MGNPQVAPVFEATPGAGPLEGVLTIVEVAAIFEMLQDLLDGGRSVEMGEFAAQLFAAVSAATECTQGAIVQRAVHTSSEELTIPWIFRRRSSGEVA